MEISAKKRFFQSNKSVLHHIAGNVDPVSGDWGLASAFPHVHPSSLKRSVFFQRLFFSEKSDYTFEFEMSLSSFFPSFWAIAIL